jgi:DNA adenine methylase
MKSYIRYIGNKQKLLPHILPLIPEHTTYVEVFGGGASVLIHKKRSPVEVYNDKNYDLYNFFRCLVNPETYQEMVLKLNLSPHSREWFKDMKDQAGMTLVEKACAWFYLQHCSFVGYAKDYGYVISSVSKGLPSNIKMYLDKIKGLRTLFSRLRFVQIENLDFRDCLQRYDSPETFFYCDPPYIVVERNTPEYQETMRISDHRAMIKLLRDCVKGKVLLSGYNHQVYKELGWPRTDIEHQTSFLGNRKGEFDKVRIESLWRNYGR